MPLFCTATVHLASLTRRCVRVAEALTEMHQSPAILIRKKDSRVNVVSLLFVAFVARLHMLLLSLSLSLSTINKDVFLPRSALSLPVCDVVVVVNRSLIRVPPPTHYPHVAQRASVAISKSGTCRSSFGSLARSHAPTEFSPSNRANPLLTSDCTHQSNSQSVRPVPNPSLQHFRSDTSHYQQQQPCSPLLPALITLLPTRRSVNARWDTPRWKSRARSQSTPSARSQSNPSARRSFRTRFGFDYGISVQTEPFDSQLSRSPRLATQYRTV